SRPLPGDVCSSQPLPGQLRAIALLAQVAEALRVGLELLPLRGRDAIEGRGPIQLIERPHQALAVRRRPDAVSCQVTGACKAAVPLRPVGIAEAGVPVGVAAVGPARVV